MINVTDAQIIIDIADLPGLVVEKDRYGDLSPKTKTSYWGSDKGDMENLAQSAALLLCYRRQREEKRLAELREHERKVAHVAAELTERIDPATLKQLDYLGLSDLPAQLATSLLANPGKGITVYLPKEDA